MTDTDVCVIYLLSDWVNRNLCVCSKTNYAVEVTEVYWMTVWSLAECTFASSGMSLSSSTTTQPPLRAFASAPMPTSLLLLAWTVLWSSSALIDHHWLVLPFLSRLWKRFRFLNATRFVCVCKMWFKNGGYFFIFLQQRDCSFVCTYIVKVQRLRL